VPIKELFVFPKTGVIPMCCF